MRFAVNRLFFGFRVPANQEPWPSDEARREQLRFWHELAVVGKWICYATALISGGLGLSLCALLPQPRACGVVRALLLILLWTHIVYPLGKAIVRTVVLWRARRGKSMDGLLNVCPGIMDFADVGAQHPEFLAWRVQKIVAEEELLRRVYEVADRTTSLTELIREELEHEAENFRAAYQDQTAIDDPSMALQDDR